MVVEGVMRRRGKGRRRPEVRVVGGGARICTVADDGDGDGIGGDPVWRGHVDTALPTDDVGDAAMDA